MKETLSFLRKTLLGFGKRDRYKPLAEAPNANSIIYRIPRGYLLLFQRKETKVLDGGRHQQILEEVLEGNGRGKTTSGRSGRHGRSNVNRRKLKREIGQKE